MPFFFADESGRDFFPYLRFLSETFFRLLGGGGGGGCTCTQSIPPASRRRLSHEAFMQRNLLRCFIISFPNRSGEEIMYSLSTTTIAC